MAKPRTIEGYDKKITKRNTENLKAGKIKNILKILYEQLLNGAQTTKGWVRQTSEEHSAVSYSVCYRAREQEVGIWLFGPSPIDGESVKIVHEHFGRRRRRLEQRAVRV